MGFIRSLPLLGISVNLSTTFSIAINGIPFEPVTAEHYHNYPQSKWNYEALTGHLNLGIDENDVHV